MESDVKPSDGELALLRVLWDRGACTVRVVHDALQSGSAYTTTLKVLQIMHEKGLVVRDTSQRSHVYQAAISEELVQRSLVGDLLHKAFAGSAVRLAMRALSIDKSTPEEIAELRALLDAHERGQK